MAAINQEAIQELNLTLDMLMPESLASGVDAVTTLTVRSITPTGIGGFVELNDSGSAYIHGRRLQALFCVILQGNNTSNLQQSAYEVIQALVGAERETLAGSGIFKITQSGNEFQTLLGANREIKLSFELTYEYLQTPEETEEIIDEIPINLEIDAGEA